MAEKHFQESCVYRSNKDVLSVSLSRDSSFNVIIDAFVKHVEISVTEAEKRVNSAINIREFYTVYLIETKVIDENFRGGLSKSCTLWRRYSEFESLRTHLVNCYSHVIMPPLPEKRASHAWQNIPTDTLDPDFVDRRRVGLENFLLRVASHPEMSWDQLFLHFLQDEREWKDIISDKGYIGKLQNKLKSLNASLRVRRTDKRFDEIQSYSRDLHTHINHVLKIRARLAERTYTIYKAHLDYGCILSEWSAIERDMGEGLQKAGHHMDSLAGQVDSVLEEEETCADQLKEYGGLADSLQSVCHHQTLLQYRLDKLDDSLANRSQQREQVLQGKIRLMSLLWGSVDTEEVKELKLVQLDQQIDANEHEIKAASEELEQFIQKALAEVELFQEHKKKDLKETLINYVILQIKMCKKGLQTWTAFRGCVDEM